MQTKKDQRSTRQPLIALLSCVVSVCLLPVQVVYAQDYESVLYGGTLTAAYRQDSYDIRDGLDAESYSFDTSFYALDKNWSAGIYLPWQSADGLATLNDSTLQLIAVCRRLSGLDRDTLIALAVRNDRVRQVAVQCSRLQLRDLFDQEKTSGFADISVDVGYTFSPGDSASQSLGLLLVLTGDNGDVDRGLGSGTVDASLQLNYDHYFSALDVAVAAGRNFVLGGSLQDIYDDYSFASVDIGRRFGRHFSLYCGAYWAESSLPEADDSRSASLEAGYRISDAWQLRAVYTSYFNKRGYPEREFSASASFHF